MIKTGKQLVTKRYTGNEFKNVSVFREGVTVNDLNKKFKSNNTKCKVRKLVKTKKY